jgi:hypothetical protein
MKITLTIEEAKRLGDKLYDVASVSDRDTADPVFDLVEMAYDEVTGDIVVAGISKINVEELS